MRKLVLVTLLVITVVNLVILVMALTNEASVFYGYSLVIGIALLTFGGLLTRHLLRYNKKTEVN